MEVGKRLEDRIFHEDGAAGLGVAFGFCLAVASLQPACGGALVTPATEPCTSAGCSCTKNEDCGSIALACRDSVCVEVPRCSPLETAGHCQAGLVCSGGVCITPESAAWCNCREGESCNRGACEEVDGTNFCSAERPYGACALPTVCVAGTCTEMTTDTVCSPGHLYGLCPEGARCNSEGYCVPASTTPCGPQALDGTCSPGLLCSSSGVCELPACSPSILYGRCPEEELCSRAGTCIEPGTCAIDADCGEHYVCQGNACVRDFACEGQSDCFSYEFCSVVGECALNGTCRDPGDCPGGKCGVSGHCLAALACEATEDCVDEEFCSSAGTCLLPGSCADTPDCPPGHACDSTTCGVAGVLCDLNPTDPAVCPAGSHCCDPGERCSSSHSCISSGQCVNDSDCLDGYYACINYVCQPLTYCASGCGADVCSLTGGCRPADKCVTDGDCLEGEICNGLFECVQGGCGSEDYQATLVKPNMLVLLDRSGSMNLCSSGVTTTRWDQAVAAIEGVMDAHSDKIRFGLSTYPQQCAATYPCTKSCVSNETDCDNFCGTSSDNCQPGGVDVAVDDDTATDIMGSLGDNFAGGRTPTGATLRKIHDSPHTYGLPSATEELPRENYLLLITDGDANCETSPTSKVNTALDNLLALTPTIHTFVVGFAFSSIKASMNCHAVHGGTSRCAASVTASNCGSYTTSACYYQANDTDTLIDAFDDIAAEVAGCSYKLGAVPADPSRLYVYFYYATAPETPVRMPRDLTHADNWDYDEGQNQVLIFGNACAAIQARAATLRVVYGCPVSGG